MHMSATRFTLEQLQSMIGLRVRYRGMHCRIFEVLHEGPSLVLEGLDRSSTIQPDQYGNAGRRVTPVYTIPVLEADGDTLDKRFLDLEIID